MLKGTSHQIRFVQKWYSLKDLGGRHATLDFKKILLTLPLFLGGL
jgi:hypothetical protein